MNPKKEGAARANVPPPNDSNHATHDSRTRLCVNTLLSRRRS